LATLDMFMMSATRRNAVWPDWRSRSQMSESCKNGRFHSQSPQL